MRLKSLENGYPVKQRKNVSFRRITHYLSRDSLSCRNESRSWLILHESYVLELSLLWASGSYENSLQIYSSSFLRHSTENCCSYIFYSKTSYQACILFYSIIFIAEVIWVNPWKRRNIIILSECFDRLKSIWNISSSFFNFNWKYSLNDLHCRIHSTWSRDHSNSSDSAVVIFFECNFSSSNFE